MTTPRATFPVKKAAERMDLRDHLAQSLQLSTETVEELCTRPLENEVNSLELIIFKVIHRPDAFSMPSFASTFPFLEAICPSDSPGWHISRARLLEHYTASWVRLDRLTEETSFITLPGESKVDEPERTGGGNIAFLLTLIPKEWGMEDIQPKLLKACVAVACNSEKPGSMTRRKGFEGS
ncbi:hypothetical protein SI65_02372 [Aspergillus cristatus]|uniref:Uncharacterized protein n=1 Tax=Aspergillus cristatus TaxID=573508 RepID=A0A1E3BKU4_ASPCR|nr:hypothetical protein SI65_02372 [Aspergillus cristatus]